MAKNSAHLKSNDVVVLANAVQQPRELDVTPLKSSQQLLHDLNVHQIELTMQNEELRLAHIALERSREQYFDLYDRAPVGYITLSKRGLIIEANLTAATLLDRNKRDLVGQALSRFIASEHQDMYYLHINRMLKAYPDEIAHSSRTGEQAEKDWSAGASQNEELLAWDLKMMKQDRTSFWVHMHAIMIHEHGPEPVIRVVMSDITKRKRTEDALKLIDIQLRATLESTVDGILAISNTGALLHFSRRFIELWHIPLDVMNIADQSLLMNFLGDQLIDPKAFASKVQVLLNSDIEDIDILTFKTGQILESFSLPMILDGVRQGRVWSFRDITAKNAAETERLRFNAELELRVMERTAQLEAANSELDTFCYTISHDLMTPLRHLDGYAHLLVSRCRESLPDKGQYYVDTIAASARQMGLLITALLRLSRTTNGKLVSENVDLNQCVNDIVITMSEINSERSIEWVIGRLPSICGDPVLLRQVLTNLIENAVKFTRTRKDARIEVSAREEATEHIVDVIDNGVGFDMKYAGKLFGVFQRMHRIDQYEGNGIGLASVQRIITRHGGRVWAEAELDKGATFHFSLPK